VAARPAEVEKGIRLGRVVREALEGDAVVANEQGAIPAGAGGLERVDQETLVDRRQHHRNQLSTRATGRDRHRHRPPAVHAAHHRRVNHGPSGICIGMGAEVAPIGNVDTDPGTTLADVLHNLTGGIDDDYGAQVLDRRQQVEHVVAVAGGGSGELYTGPDGPDPLPEGREPVTEAARLRGDEPGRLLAFDGAQPLLVTRDDGPGEGRDQREREGRAGKKGERERSRPAPGYRAAPGRSACG
jgi:hypothetical protein